MKIYIGLLLPEILQMCYNDNREAYMAWVKDKFRYSSTKLRRFAAGYSGIDYDMRFERWGELAEVKADFDNALDGIGQGKWLGHLNPPFKTYRNYGDYQRIVIADVLGITDRELTRLRFDDIIGLRKTAYRMMCQFLNRGIE